MGYEWVTSGLRVGYEWVTSGLGVGDGDNTDSLVTVTGCKPLTGYGPCRPPNHCTKEVGTFCFKT